MKQTYGNKESRTANIMRYRSFYFDTQHYKQSKKLWQRKLEIIGMKIFSRE